MKGLTYSRVNPVCSTLINPTSEHEIVFDHLCAPTGMGHEAKTLHTISKLLHKTSSAM
jgi:hypothetical protein